jgi:hypothetical protein
MKSFQAHLILHDTPDEITCRAFSLTLKGDAREWFGKLLHKFVDNFEFLRCQFLTKFLAIQKRKKSPTYLLSLIQGKNDSLKDYMIKFNREKLSIESLKEEIVLSAFMNEIKTEWKMMAELAQRPTLMTLR